MQKVFVIPSLNFMYVLKVPIKALLVLEHARANVALEFLDITNTMHGGQVLFQVMFLCKLPAANLALVRCVRVLWSAEAAAASSMRRFVVGANR